MNQKYCSCLDSSGKEKKVYFNQDEAEQTAKYQSKIHNKDLEVYRCPDNEYQWHIRKKKSY